jgi:beta-mannosidase
MEREFNIPEDPYNYAYLSQILQARGLSEAFISHREKDWCDGSLFWQFNEPWPGINWSAVDYFGKPKALYYEAKRCFAPQYVYVGEEKGKICIHLLNNKVLKNVALELCLYHTNGSLLYSEKIFRKFVDGNEVLTRYPSKKFTKMGDEQNLILYFRLLKENTVLSENFYTFVPLQDLGLEEPKFTISGESNGLVKLSTDKPALYVHPVREEALEDDYFILFPGVEKELDIDDSVKVRTIFDVLN